MDIPLFRGSVQTARGFATSADTALGLSINHTKDVMGTTADFLGIEFDSKYIF